MADIEYSGAYDAQGSEHAQGGGFGRMSGRAPDFRRSARLRGQFGHLGREIGQDAAHRQRDVNGRDLAGDGRRAGQDLAKRVDVLAVVWHEGRLAPAAHGKAG